MHFGYLEIWPQPCEATIAEFLPRGKQSIKIEESDESSISLRESRLLGGSQRRIGEPERHHSPLLEFTLEMP